MGGGGSKAPKVAAPAPAVAAPVQTVAQPVSKPAQVVEEAKSSEGNLTKTTVTGEEKETEVTIGNRTLRLKKKQGTKRLRVANGEVGKGDGHSSSVGGTGSGDSGLGGFGDKEGQASV